MSDVPTAMGYWRWEDVEPSRHRFDAAGVGATVDASLVVGRDRDAVGQAIDRALLAEHGTWIAGWRWAASEPGCGGLVQAWCCAAHSLLRKGEAREDSVARVVAAVQDWRAVLEQLADVFAELRAAQATVEHAATRLLPIVLERTDASDAWYATFATVLGWYLESAGYDGDAVGPAVDAVSGGRFASWMAPEASVAAATMVEIQQAVSNALRAAPEVRDALGAWLAVRARAIPPMTAGAPAVVTTDAHRRWIDENDHARAPDRAERMRAALQACRASATRGEPLAFDRLAAWQALVLGLDEAPPFRATEAFAKAGRERYALASDTEAQFRAAIEEANDAGSPASVRAAKAYLDVCFFHPFADGNARAARLALDHVLTGAGLALHAVGPIFVIARAADDARGLYNLTSTIDHLAGPRSST